MSTPLLSGQFREGKVDANTSVRGSGEIALPVYKHELTNGDVKSEAGRKEVPCLPLQFLQHSEIMQPPAQSLLNTYSETTATKERVNQGEPHSASDALPDLTNQIQGRSDYPTISGGFGDIWKCELMKLDEIVQVAVKTIRVFELEDDVSRRKTSRRVRRELKVWGRLKHDCILPLWGVANNFGPYPAMICPWVHNGPLTGFLGRQQDVLSSHDKFSLLNDIALGLQYLHSKSIVHGDLTGSNVLIQGDGRACLADFGLSTMVLEFIGPSYLTSSIRGNIRWAAAELFEIPEDDEDEAAVSLSIECDIYSFGSIVLQVLTCKVPYYNVKKDNVVLGQVIRGKKPEPPKESQIAPLHWEFIQRCWLPRASRPSVGEIVAFTTSPNTLVSSLSEKSRDVMSTSNSTNTEVTTMRVVPYEENTRTIFGDDTLDYTITIKPWYLQPDYTNDDMIIDVDGSVRAGTVPALVEHLTSHDLSDLTFIKTFLMTYKSFTTLDEFFDHLVRRFFIQPPDWLSPSEAEEWRKLKQHVIQMRVLNIFRAMVMDENFFEKEDLSILNQMKEFLQNEEVNKILAAKQLLPLVERARGGDIKKGFTPNIGSPPTSIMPKPDKKLKLMDIDPLELARQLTIMESHLYQKIRPIECLQRSLEQKTDHSDNIARVIQTCNRIANWVADSVLSHEDSKKRAVILKQFISVADRCRLMHNYSSMVAIISGLNSPPIVRLKRSWEQVNARHMSQLENCEFIINSGKNFNSYRSILAKVVPPCVPFIGVFLTTLTFIRDGSKDTLSGNLVNFRKRQKALEVIQDIQRWQTFPHNFSPISSVQTYLEESLARFSKQVDVGDYFWNLSLEREPHESVKEKMARLLQESGFL